MGAREREQQLQGGLALAGLEPRQGADRDARLLGEVGQGRLALKPQLPQPGPDRPQHSLVVHDPSLPLQQERLSILPRCLHPRDMSENEMYDVVVIGGGVAGLSGAMALGRSRRKVLVIDAGEPRNAPAAHAHNYLGREGVPPLELLEDGRAEVAAYDVEVVDDRVVGLSGGIDDFLVTTESGRRYGARRVLVTGGVVDELPDVPGLAERWGADVLHCPYCHGWEVRDRAIGVLACGPMAVHQALLFRQLSADVTLFAHTQPAPAGEQAEQLAAVGIRVVTGEVASLEVVDDRLVGVRLADGTVVEREAVTVQSRMVARTGFLAGLGLTPVPHPSGMGEHLAADATGRSNVPGVWVAGNVTDLAAQVGASAAAGAAAGAQVNYDLVVE